MRRSSILLASALQLFWFYAHAHAEETSGASISQDTATFSFSLTDLTDPLARWSNQRLLQAVAKPEAMSYELAPYVWSIASRWVRNNQWAGRVRVNAPPRKDGLNIFIVQRKFLNANGFTDLEAVCPCEYLVGTNSIVCIDDALKRAVTSLDRFTEERDSKDKDRDEAIQMIRRQHRTFMSEWIIAHELGHLVLNHTFADLRRSWDLANQHVGLDAEREADLFYVSSLQHQNFSQFASNMGLSQLMTAQYAQELEAKYGKEKLRSGEIVVFAANVPVELKISPFEHPPMLLRALNLYKSLLFRYPGMVDSSGYVDRIASQIQYTQASHTIPPAFCQRPATDSQPADEALETLVQFADLYLYGGHEDWARSILSRMHHRVETGPGSDAWKSLWRATIAHTTARVNWKFKKEAPDWHALDSLTASLDGDGKQFGLIQSEMTKSFTGSRASAQEGIEAATRIEGTIKELISKNALNVADDDDVYDVLSTYLVLSFVPAEKTDEKYFEYVDQVVGRIASLKTLSPIRRRIAVDTVRDFALTLAAKGEPYRFAVVRLMSLLVTMSNAFQWPFEEIDYRVSEIGFLKQYYAQQYPVIANREIALGQMLPRWGQSSQALLVTQDALKQIQTVDVSQAPTKDRRRWEEWQFKVQNDIGWLLINNGRFDEAVPVLQSVLQSRENGHRDSTPCKSDSEVLHVYQNIADAYLALGNWNEAIKFSRKAVSCVADSPDSKEWYDAAKTAGLALAGAGQTDEAKKILRDFVVKLAIGLDDNEIAKVSLTATANGKQVSVNDVINVGETIQKARQKSPKADAPTVRKKK